MGDADGRVRVSCERAKSRPRTPTHPPASADEAATAMRRSPPVASARLFATARVHASPGAGRSWRDGGVMAGSSACSPIRRK